MRHKRDDNSEMTRELCSVFHSLEFTACVANDIKNGRVFFVASISFWAVASLLLRITRLLRENSLPISSISSLVALRSGRLSRKKSNSTMLEDLRGISVMESPTNFLSVMAAEPEWANMLFTASMPANG